MDGSIVGDIWHQGVGQEEARYEPRDMGVVVHPRHEAKENENCQDCQQFREGFFGFQKDGPNVNDLYY